MTIADMGAHVPGGSPLHLTPAERIAHLRSIGLGDGWLLLTMAEMLQMRHQMVAEDKENCRLKAENAQLLKQLKVLRKGKAADLTKQIVDDCSKVVPMPKPEEPKP